MEHPVISCCTTYMQLQTSAAPVSCRVQPACMRASKLQQLAARMHKHRKYVAGKQPAPWFCILHAHIHNLSVSSSLPPCTPPAECSQTGLEGGRFPGSPATRAQLEAGTVFQVSSKGAGSSMQGCCGRQLAHLVCRFTVGVVVGSLADVIVEQGSCDKGAQQAAHHALLAAMSGQGAGVLRPRDHPHGRAVPAPGLGGIAGGGGGVRVVQGGSRAFGGFSEAAVADDLGGWRRRQLESSVSEGTKWRRCDGRYRMHVRGR
jgi:hypothetical protein